MNSSNADSKHVPPPIMPGAILCTVAQAAAMLGRGTSFIYEAIGDGRLKAVKSDTRTLIVIESVRDYVASLPAAKITTTRRRHERQTAVA
jgi:excisionase family DNA binding protein